MKTNENEPLNKWINLLNERNVLKIQSSINYSDISTSKKKQMIRVNVKS